MSSKASIILIPGSFALPFLYDDVVAKTKARGIDIQAIKLETTGKKPGPLPTIYDDAAVIRQVATKLADEGKDVVLVGHSYGGVPATEAIKGISKAEREKEGKKGGVVRVAYMTCLVPAVGENAGDVLAAAQPADEEPKQLLAPDADGWLYHVDQAYIASICFNDLPPEQGLEWVKKFVQHSSASFGNPLTYPGYNDVPVSYFFCENDKCVTPEVQQRGIDIIEKASGNKVDVKRVNSDHIPPVGHEEETVEWYVELAEKSA